MVTKKLVTIIVSGCLYVWISCVGSDVSGVTDMPNEGGIVTAVVKDTLGKPVGNALVTLVSADFIVYEGNDPDSAVVQVRTEKSGFFSIENLAAGSYSLEINNQKTAAARVRFEATLEDSVNSLGEVTLLPYSSVVGVLDTSVQKFNGAYIQVVGLNRTIAIDADGSFQNDSMPQGTFELQVVFEDDDQRQTKKLRSVSLIAGQTKRIENPVWSQIKKIHFNTTASGINLSENVYSFPVLVRLTEEIFDFSQARNEGQDIRFNKSGGEQIPYEVEYWDYSSERAYIWVKMDTIYANSDSQFITMSWGNPEAKRLSSSESVFDESSGFKAVWHLSENRGVVAADASHHTIDGTYQGALPSAVNSTVTRAQRFSSVNDYISLGDTLNPGLNNLTISAWIKPMVTDTRMTIISKTQALNSPTDRHLYGFSFQVTEMNDLRFYISAGGSTWGNDNTFRLSTKSAVIDTAQWHHVTVVIDRADKDRCKLFINGIDRTLLKYGEPETLTYITNVHDARIGLQANGRDAFYGYIADVNLSFDARSDNWVKLSYLNQRPNSDFLQFGLP